MATERTVAIGASSLSIDDVDRLASGAARVDLTPAARQRLQRSYEFLQSVARTPMPVYGLTTGCGPLAAHPIAPTERTTFQRNLVRSHAVTLGPLHATPFVRAAMAVRAQTLARGASGVDPATVDLLIAMLNHGIHPLVREVGSVGASGDLVELAQIALSVIGEGHVEFRGDRVLAADALQSVGLAPLVPRFREGLALMNGTSFHTGAAAVLAARADRLLEAAQIAAAMCFEALRGNLDALDPALQMVRAHPGQRRIAERVCALIVGSSLVRTADTSAGSQDAYTLRCIPQVLGPVADILTSAAGVIHTEINSIIDNPLFLIDEQRVVHGGNFHGQPVAMALDQLKLALVEIGVMSERRLARLLDAQLNAGLPPFLISNAAGLQSGFMGLQYCASSMAADNAVLAAPASVRSLPTNASNQDVVSMGMVAARQAALVLDNVTRMVAIELLCAAQALDLRGAIHAGAGTRAAHSLVRTLAQPLTDDRPLADDVATLCQIIENRALIAAVDAAS